MRRKERGEQVGEFFEIFFKTNFFANLCVSNLKDKKSVRTFTARRKMQRKKGFCIEQEILLQRKEEGWQKMHQKFFFLLCLSRNATGVGWGKKFFMQSENAQKWVWVLPIVKVKIVQKTVVSRL